jgi:NAD+ kinase
MSTSTFETGMPTDLFLVRHGESEGNVALNAAKGGDHSYLTDDFAGRSTLDWRLSAEGTRQAGMTGTWIRNWMAQQGVEEFDRLYCSPFARARETAALLGIPGAAWQLEPLLRERDFGLWEGLPRSEIEAAFPRSAEQKTRNRFLWRPENGESTPDMDMRVREVLATLARELPRQRVLCVTHEDVMWTFRFRLEKMTISEWLVHQDDDRHDIVNCGILHYTRTLDDGPNAEVGPKFARVRLINPNQPDTATWTEITRPRFTDAELLDGLSGIPPLWPDRRG